jgi:hypothetical protein
MYVPLCLGPALESCSFCSGRKRSLHSILGLFDVVCHDIILTGTEAHTCIAAIFCIYDFIEIYIWNVQGA